jgi:tetratricopeptide (TPR) repeat protein
MIGPPPSSEYALVSLLGKKCSTRAGGILTAVRGKLKRLFCLEKGALVFAASNIVEEQFPEYLVQENLLSPVDRAAAKSESAAEKRSILDVIRQCGYVDEDTLRRAMESQIESLLRSCLSWPDGKFSFDAGSPKLDGQVKGRLSIIPLVMEHVQNYPGSVEQVLMRIGPPDAKLETDSRGSEIFSEIEPDDICRFLMDNGDGTRVVGEIAEEAPCENNAAIRAVYGLKLLGVMNAVKDETPAAKPEEEVLTRDEVLGRLAKAAGGDHYVVLGLDKSASRDEIRSAYYSLARRMHPDRFRTGDMQDLLGRIEKFFKRVTEAYNTLHDPDLRREYNRMIADAFRKDEEAEKTDTKYLAKQNYLKGKALVEMRRFVDAVAFLENAVKMDDTQADYHFELGSLLARNPRRKGDAERHLFRTTELDPSRWQAYLVLGHLYRRAERVDEAATAFRAVLRLEPDHAEAKSELRDMGFAVKGRGERETLRPLFGG